MAGLRVEDRTAPPLVAAGLTKRYGNFTAVADLELEVPAGSVFGFLGPNGAGKTTSLRMFLGLIRPTAGTVRLFGRDPWREGAAALAPVGGFVETPRFYPYLTAFDNLRLLATLDGLRQPEQLIGELLELVELSHAARQKVGSFSHGMGQRLGIAAALLRRPKLLILDEPTTGLDPAGIRDMRLLIGRLSGEGITVLLSSHQLAEVQEVCSHVAIIRAGRVAFCGALQELQAARRSWRLRTADNGRARQLAELVEGVRVVGEAEGELALAGEEEAVGALTVELGKAGIMIYRLQPHAPSLEELFFALTEADGDGRTPLLVGEGR
jgi:ABC-2 type transport system ATP-binding protein